MKIKLIALKFYVALNLCFISFPSFSSGPLVIIGGNLSDDNNEIYDKFIDLAGGEDAIIGVVTAASRAHYERNQQSYIALFARRRIQAKWLEIHIDKPNGAWEPDTVNQIKSVTAIFFGGGDQSLLKSLLVDKSGKDSNALRLIREKHELGMPIAGTSAGAVILSGLPNVMITGGWPIKALLTNAVALVPNVDAGRLTYDPKSGFGFFAYGILDTHLSQRNRQGRLIRLASDTSARFGFGIDEDTSLVVEGNDSGKPMMTAYGSNGIFIVDLLNAEVNYDSDDNWGISNVKHHYLKRGDRFDSDAGVAWLNSKTDFDFPMIDSVINYNKDDRYQIVRSLDSESVVSIEGAISNSTLRIFRDSSETAE